MRFKLELVPVPRIDADCAKTFDADQAGFNVDLDFSHGETFRGAQLTPPGSACSIAIVIGVITFSYAYDSQAKGERNGAAGKGHPRRRHRRELAVPVACPISQPSGVSHGH